MSIIESLERLSIRYEQSYSLKNASTFHIGGSCRLAIFPDSAEKIAQAARLCSQHGEKFFIVGKGSNTLFGDGKLECTLIFTGGARGVRFDGTYVAAEAGVSLIYLSGLACEHGLGGLEFASGIPGSIGGAVYMNAGAYKECMADIVESSTALDCTTGEIFKITDHTYSYRKSIYISNKKLVCLDARLSLFYKESGLSKAKMKVLNNMRRDKQPLEYPSAGSYFKRPEGDFAGRLIEACGLKGTQVGGAQVSEKHAGFIINRGGASCLDVLSLEELVRNEVFKQTGVILEREVELIE